jgi:small nuclear ribonucleoprotein F
MSSAAASTSPAAFLQALVTKQVTVKSKWGQVWTATLLSVDKYMNLQLTDCTQRGTDLGVMNDVVIRCNNVLYIKEGVAAEATA